MVSVFTSAGPGPLLLSDSMRHADAVPSEKSANSITELGNDALITWSDGPLRAGVAGQFSALARGMPPDVDG
jgi:hypothetical protein